MSHGLNPGYKSGEHWVECERCGKHRYASQIVVERSKGGHKTFKVCKDGCFDPVHPQEFVRAVDDKVKANEPVRTPSEPEYTDVTFLDPTSAVPDGTFTVD